MIPFTAGHVQRSGEDRVGTQVGSVARGTHEFHIAGYSARKPFARVTAGSSVKDADPSLAGGGKDVLIKSGAFQVGGYTLRAPSTTKDVFRGNEDCYLSTDDQLTNLCTVEVLQEETTAAEPTKCFVSVVPPPTIPGDFPKLLRLLEKHPETSDVTFVVEDTEILAHRLVLAMRSRVFTAELLGHMRESTTSRVQIDDMSASTFRAMVRFIYSDEFPVKLSNGVDVESGSKRESMARDLLVAADRVKSAKSRYTGHNGTVTIHCDIDITKEAHTTDTTTTIGRPLIVVPPSNMASHLENLMVTEQGSDLTFLVEESEIRAHRLIIAMRSPLLFVMVSSTTNKVVRLDDMRAVVLRAVIHYVYTDELPPVGDVVVAGEMIADACRLGMKRMKAMCENLVGQLVKKDNAVSILELAWRHQCKELKLYCAEFISFAMK
ncbi:unnamed protein product [Alopecurus aequalis]